MSQIVSATEIVRVVGAPRHPADHIGRAVSVEETVYILHSQECVDSGVDLRACLFSVAMDAGIDVARWRGEEDRPVVLAVEKGRLIPLKAHAIPTPTEETR